MWQAEVVAIDQKELSAEVTVLFTDGSRQDKQVFEISNLNDLPRICWNQIAQHELLDDIGNTKVKLGPVDVSSFRPKAVTPPTPEEIARQVWVKNYQDLKKMQLAIVQKFKTEADQDFIDLTALVASTYRQDYFSLLLP